MKIHTHTHACTHSRIHIRTLNTKRSSKENTDRLTLHTHSIHTMSSLFRYCCFVFFGVFCYFSRMADHHSLAKTNPFACMLGVCVHMYFRSMQIKHEKYHSIFYFFLNVVVVVDVIDFVYFHLRSHISIWLLFADFLFALYIFFSNLFVIELVNSSQKKIEKKKNQQQQRHSHTRTQLQNDS